MARQLTTSATAVWSGSPASAAASIPAAPIVCDRDQRMAGCGRAAADRAARILRQASLFPAVPAAAVDATAYGNRLPSSRGRETTAAMLAMSASWARTPASWRSATAAIMQSSSPRGVTPRPRHRR